MWRKLGLPNWRAVSRTSSASFGEAGWPSMDTATGVPASRTYVLPAMSDGGAPSLPSKIWWFSTARYVYFARVTASADAASTSILTFSASLDTTGAFLPLTSIDSSDFVLRSSIHDAPTGGTRKASVIVSRSATVVVGAVGAPLGHAARPNASITQRECMVRTL